MFDGGAGAVDGVVDGGGCAVNGVVDGGVGAVDCRWCGAVCTDEPDFS